MMKKQQTGVFRSVLCIIRYFCIYIRLFHVKQYNIYACMLILQCRLSTEPTVYPQNYPQYIYLFHVKQCFCVFHVKHFVKHGKKTIWFQCLFKTNNRAVFLEKRSSQAIVGTIIDQESKQSSTENYTHILTVFWLKKAVRYTMFHVKHSYGLCKLLVSQKTICYACLNINLF